MKKFFAFFVNKLTKDNTTENNSLNESQGLAELEASAEMENNSLNEARELAELKASAENEARELAELKATAEAELLAMNFLLNVLTPVE